jgi:hypothetical protein
MLREIHTVADTQGAKEDAKEGASLTPRPVKLKGSRAILPLRIGLPRRRLSAFPSSSNMSFLFLLFGQLSNNLERVFFSSQWYK